MVFAVPAQARVDAVLLSDELVALPSSLSDAESAPAADTFEAVAVTDEAAVAEPPAVAVAVEVGAGLGVGVGTWPSLRLRISGVSDTVLIFNFPSSEVSTEADVTLFPLSELLSASSPE